MSLRITAAALMGAASLISCLLCAPAALAATPLLVGQTGTIAVEQSPDAATGSAATYTSTNSKVVSVSSSGTFKARKAGNAVLTSINNDKKQSTAFTVYAQDSSKTNRPKAPGNLTVAQASEASALLSWKKQSGASGYAIYQKTDSSYALVRLVAGGNATSCTIEGLSPNTTTTFAACSYKKVTVKVKQGKKTVKETRLALSSKTPSVSLILENEQSSSANASGVAFKRNQITIVGKGTAEVMAYATSSSSTLPVCDEKLRYTSSNPKVVSVNSEGGVQSHSSKAASCTITATAHNGLQSSIKVRVIDKLTSKSCVFIAHRGDMQAAPENTTAAVVMTALNGYSSFEFDVWETYTGDLVVSHDQSLKRMYGIDKDVRELNTNDIDSAGYYGNFKIAAGSNVEQYRELTIPTFEEAVRLAAGFGLDAIVHVKNPESDPLSQGGLNQILKVLDLYGMKGETVFTCSTMSTAKEIIAMGFPSYYPISNGIDYSVKSGDYLSELKRTAAQAAEAGFARIGLKYYESAPFDADFIDYCHGLGLAVDSWGVTSKKRACLLIDMGIDSITSDKKLFG